MSFSKCTKVYGKTRVYYIHSSWCRAASRLYRRLGRTPHRWEVLAEIERVKRRPSVAARR
ncbi:hypothetical protein ML5_0866 [Micromonospora sp. L5]|uniref:hypothetical protein n=1 Tax=Micromonospora sp. (strain L5) TaxID=648999 RepID=UPI0001C45C92|nr:hypothetical protein [Micromonospora sp. L5]ADU06408.1 hypothetical protein ML5_0866 [Micromonospora sp. L5]